MIHDLSRYRGKPSGWTARSELDHFIQCPVCKTFLDCRDLEQVFEHWHNGPTEIVEMKKPDPAQG